MGDIRLRGVRKRFAATEVIHGVDLDVGEGELLVVVGPSGCGKSTLLRMIAGLEVVSAGEITIGGRVVNDLEPKDRNIAMVFQNYALYPHMSVFDNMAYGLKIARLSKAEIRERVGAVAALLELDGLLERRPQQLSGGQRQRVAMGRAIVRDPAAFLFDEPLSNLDAKLRVQMRVEIKELQRRLGTTSLYVTHDQIEAMTLADRLMVMNEGMAEQVDTPLAVYREPASVFVAGFIGSPAMNFLPARVGDGGRGLTVDGAGPLLDDELANRAAALAELAGQPVTVGLRPEQLRPADGREPRLTITVDLVETLGADTLVHGRFGEPGHRLVVRLPGTSAVAEGDRLPLVLDSEALHVFDGRGRRVAWL